MYIHEVSSLTYTGLVLTLNISLTKLFKFRVQELVQYM